MRLFVSATGNGSCDSETVLHGSPVEEIVTVPSLPKQRFAALHSTLKDERAFVGRIYRRVAADSRATLN